jgi:hypothetical protein
MYALSYQLENNVDALVIEQTATSTVGHAMPIISQCSATKVILLNATLSKLGKKEILSSQVVG